MRAERFPRAGGVLPLAAVLAVSLVPPAAVGAAAPSGGSGAAGAAGTPAATAAAEPAELDPTGLWWADRGGARVEIQRCGEALCGRIVWLRSPFDEHGCPLRDENNPDPALRDRELIGVELLRAMRPSEDEDGLWTNGEVYDPSSGRTYDGRMRLKGPDRLELRGYLGIRLLGKTVTWIRVGKECTCDDEG